MTRRSLLSLVALLLIGANIAFFALRSGDAPIGETATNGDAEPEEFAARWIAFMPDFEASQRSDPERYGVHNPPPRNIAYVMEEGRAVSAVGMVAGECALERYIVRGRGDYDEYMPDRLFAASLSSVQQDCLREHLPDGYALSQLATPVKPSKVSWLTDPSTLSVQEGTNAQTH